MKLVVAPLSVVTNVNWKHFDSNVPSNMYVVEVMGGWSERFSFESRLKRANASSRSNVQRQFVPSSNGEGS